MNKQTVVEGALEVVEDAFCNSEMGPMRVLHVKIAMSLA
jgi:hypothetical protein